MEQEQAVKLESDWVEGYSPLQAERTSEVGRNVAEASAIESISQNEVVCSRKTSPGKTAKEKFLSSESVPAGFQDQQGETLQWPPAGELPTEGRETRLQRDSEYFVSEEEALAQRILKWQQDVVEQEEVAELESEWALDSQSKQSGSRLPFETISPFDSEPHHGGISHETDPTDLRSPHTLLAGEALPTKKPSPPAAGCEPSPHGSSFITRYSPTHPALPHHAGAPVERSYDLKTTPLKDTMGLEASPVQRYSPTQFTSAPQGESPHKPSQEFSSVRRRSPCRRPQESVEKATERSWSREEYSMSADKSSSQRFQSDMREERGMREELGSTRETSEWRQQKGFAGVRREERHEDLIRSQQGDEMSAEIHELGATRKKEDRVQEESNFKEGVYQSQESKTVKEGVTSARGSRPVFVKEMSSVKVKIGEMSEFTCQFHGDPLPTVTWLKDGHPLAHNLDYDTIRKSNKSTLTIFYPTTDHEGTYDCVITNKHGKSICTATLEISDKKVVRRSESLMEEELQRHCSDESLSSSTVEIRITAATPVPEMTEENTDDKPQAFTENPSGVPSDEGASQTVKHKFTFSFDVVGEAPHVISELENITCSEDNTAVLECVITGEPAAEVEWYCNDIRLELTGGKYRVEVDDKVYRLYINSFTYTDAGVYKCVARNRLGEVTSISDVSFQVAEPLQFSKRGGAVEDDVFHKAGITYTKSLPQQISIPEPSLDSGVFLSMPDTQANVTKVAEGMVADDVVDPHTQIMGEDGHVKAEHKPLIVKPKVDMVGRIKPLSLPVDAVVQGQERCSSDRASAAEAGGAAAAVSPMEEEEVTFSAVYDYYNPPTDWGRPLSPESEMSIEIGSTGLQEKVQGIPPAFLKPLIKKRVFENDSLTFCAEVFGLPSPDVKWFCNKTQLVADDRVKMERDGDTISLTIHNVTKADQGEYICEAVNYVGEARSVALVVVVSQEVRFMPAPPAVTHQHVMEFDVEEDDSSRSPSPQEILLEVELDENEVKEFEKQVKIITIPDINFDVFAEPAKDDKVEFKGKSSDMCSFQFQVTETAPKCVIPLTNVTAAVGTPVILQCLVSGKPNPTAEWYKDGDRVADSRCIIQEKTTGHFNLLITNVTQSDAGEYKCIIQNTAGCVETTALLKVF
uniref:Ig-like domain-containing protein n=1 Tax=Seriola dumerili TaxID=41447 RepID=A0A3B4TEB1_SERDU